MEQIAHVLGVHHSTIVRDLEFVQTHKLKPSKTASNPKGAGRPKGSGGTKRQSVQLDKARALVRDNVVADKPINARKMEAEHGISHVTIETAVAAERARKEAIEDKTALDLSHLNKTSQQKVDAAIRAHKAKLNEENQLHLRERDKKFFADVWLPEHQKLIDDARAVTASTKGVWPRALYKQILSCLHVDSRKSTSDRKLDEMFNEFKKKEAVLVKPDDLTPKAPPLATYEELMARRWNVSQAKKAKRGSNSVMKH